MTITEKIKIKLYLQGLSNDKLMQIYNDFATNIMNELYKKMKNKNYILYRGI